VSSKFRLISEKNNFILFDKYIVGFNILQAGPFFSVVAHLDNRVSYVFNKLGDGVSLAMFDTESKAQRFMARLNEKTSDNTCSVMSVYLDEEEDYIDENFK
jgi:hypothetical protein